MPHDPRKLLADITQAGALIQHFTLGLDLPAYTKDDLVRAAVERKFTVIGEAVSQLLLTDAALAAQITNYRKIIDFRNALIHGYSSVNDQIVWEAVQIHLPVLLQEINQLQSKIP